MQLTITVKDGANNKDIAEALRFQANLIEGVTGKAASKKVAAPIEADEETTEGFGEGTTDDDEDFATPPVKTKGKKAAASFEDEDDDAGEEEEEPVKKAPAKKAKKLTEDDVVDACKAKAKVKGGKAGRDEVVGILKKKFKVESVTELKETQYQAAIDAMEV